MNTQDVNTQEESTQELNIHYIDHSGFYLETASVQLVFDYYRGPISLKKDKPCYVFSSHAHPDHYNQEILDWQKSFPQIQYVLSEDIRPLVSNPEAVPQLNFMSLDDILVLEDIVVKAYGSTDEGLSFLVHNEGKGIFHAGDLNWWHWWGDTPANIALAEQAFKEEIARLKGKTIELAFFPVDPRLEHNATLGAEHFIQEIEPRYLVPMHFGDNYGVIQEFAEKMKDASTHVIPLAQKGQDIRLPW